MNRIEIQIQPSATLRGWWWWAVLSGPRHDLEAFGLTYTRDQAADHAERAAAELERQEG